MCLCHQLNRRMLHQNILIYLKQRSGRYGIHQNWPSSFDTVKRTGVYESRKSPRSASIICSCFARNDRKTRYKMLQNKFFWSREVMTYGKPFKHRFYEFPSVTDSASFMRYAKSHFLDRPPSTPEGCMRPLRTISLVFWGSSRITTHPIRAAVSAAIEQCFWRRYEPFQSDGRGAPAMASWRHN